MKANKRDTKHCLDNIIGKTAIFKTFVQRTILPSENSNILHGFSFLSENIFSGPPRQTSILSIPHITLPGHVI